MNLTYRDSDHSYFLGTRQIPGITRMLADLGAYPGSQHYTEESRVRGQQVHLACQLADQHAMEAETLHDVLEIMDVAPAIQPYLEGYLKLRREKRYRAEKWEIPIASRKLRVGGRPDSTGCTWGATSRAVVLDVKSWQSQGQKPKHSAEIQTAAYAIMLVEYYGRTDLAPTDIERWTVKLPGDGSYRCYVCDDVDNFSEVHWMAQLWHKWHDKGIFKFAGDPDEISIGE